MKRGKKQTVKYTTDINKNIYIIFIYTILLTIHIFSIYITSLKIFNKKLVRNIFL